MRRDDLERLADALGGIAILGCLPESPAALAGVRYGDVLLAVNGHPTPDWVAYVRFSRERYPAMAVRVFRDGVEREYELMLSAEPMVRSGDEALLERVLQSGVLPSLLLRPDEDPKPPRA